MKKIVGLLFICSTLVLQAQEQKPIFNYKLAIHFAPFALAQIDYTFLPGIEYRLRPKTTLVAEAGIIVASDYINSNRSQSSSSGFIFRPSVRFFLNDRNTFYVQPQLFYKMVTHRIYDWLGKNCVNGTAAYEELQNFKYRRHVAGFNATAGVLVPLSKSAQSFIDFYFGIGMRFKTPRIVKEPNACYSRLGLFGNDNNDKGAFPGIPVGIKLIFVIQS